MSIQFHCSIALFDRKSWSPDGKNAAPECKSGPCLVQSLGSLIPDQMLNICSAWLQNMNQWDTFIALSICLYRVCAPFNLHSILSSTFDPILFVSVFPLVQFHSMQFSAAEPY